MKQNLSHCDLYLRLEKEGPKSCRRGKKMSHIQKELMAEHHQICEKLYCISEDTGTKSKEKRNAKTSQTSNQVKK